VRKKRSEPSITPTAIHGNTVPYIVVALAAVVEDIR